MTRMACHYAAGLTAPTGIGAPMGMFETAGITAPTGTNETARLVASVDRRRH